MEKEFTPELMEGNMKESIKMIKRMDGGFIDEQMEGCIKDIEKMGSSMDKVVMYCQMELRRKGNEIKEKG